MSRIYHILPSNTSHLVCGIVESLIKDFSDLDLFLILIGDKIDKRNLYQSIFEKEKFDNYCFFVSIGDFFKSDFHAEKIIVHGDNLKWLFYLSLRRNISVNWINWGSGLKLNSNIKSYLIYWVKRFIYSRLNSVVVLMSPNKNDLIKNFSINNVFVIPYLSKTSDVYSFPENDIYVRKNSSNKLQVYLGNNATCISFYIDFVEKMCKCKGNIEIQCMLHYSLNKENLEYKNLIFSGEKLWENDFCVNTKFYSLRDYVDYMNLCDVYVCGVSRQTGLGAIYTCLRLGKKIYLSGNNYEYISSLGCKIFNCNELFKDPYHINIPLSKEDKLHNYRIIMNLLDKNILKSKWSEYFSFVSR